MIPTGFARQGLVSFSPDGKRWAVVGAPGAATPTPGPESPLAVLVDGAVVGQPETKSNEAAPSAT